MLKYINVIYKEALSAVVKNSYFFFFPSKVNNYSLTVKNSGYIFFLLPPQWYDVPEGSIMLK